MFQLVDLCISPFFFNRSSLLKCYSEEEYLAKLHCLRQALEVSNGLIAVESRSAFTDTRQATIFCCTLFVLFYCLAVTQKSAETIYIHSHNFCRVLVNAALLLLYWPISVLFDF